MVRNTRISLGCRFLLVLLRTYCSRGGDQCWPSAETLAGDMDVCDRQVRRYIAEAKKSGLLATKPRFPGERKGVIYTLLDEDEAFRLQLCACPKGNKRTYMSKHKRTPVSYDQDVHEISSRTAEDADKIIPIRRKA